MLNDIFSQFGGTPAPKSRRPVTRVPAKVFLAQYMSSPMYKQRLAMQGISETPSVRDVLNTHVTFNKGDGSIYTGKVNGVNQINIDSKDQGVTNKMYPEFKNVQSPLDGMMAHELSHASRNLTTGEQAKFGMFNQNIPAKKLFNKWNYSTDQTYNQFIENSGEYATKAGHDAHPAEAKADLDAVRFLMFKKGIYDTSKRQMTIDDLHKALQDKDIKDNINFRRLQQRYNPYDIIDLNNTIASVASSNQNTNV